MKKLFSLFLAATMLLSVTAGLNLTAFAGGKQPTIYYMNETGSRTFVIDEEGLEGYIYFNAPETATYFFYSDETTAEDGYSPDTECYLYYGESQGEIEEVAYSDDFYGLDFGFFYKCEKGKTYWVCASMLSSYATGSFNVVIEKRNITNLAYSTKTSVKTVTEFTNGGYDIDYNSNEFYWYDLYNIAFVPGDTLTLTWSDGKKDVYTAKKFTETYDGDPYTYLDFVDSKGGYCPSFYNDIDQYETPLKVGKYTVLWKLGDKTFKTTLEIKAKGWYKSGKKWHYSKNGADVKGWIKDGNKWYYCNTKGEMVTGWLKSGSSWYYMNSSGAMVTGWQKISGKWYYFNSSGTMLIGWQKIGGKWYYFNADGDMKTGWLKSGGKWYYLDPSSGAMITGWKQISGYWYYFNSSGVMVTGSQTIGGKTYKFDSNGRWISSSSTTSASRTVYITKTGKKYHYDNHCNGGTYYTSTLNEAKNNGLTPCEKCVH